LKAFARPCLRIAGSTASVERWTSAQIAPATTEKNVRLYGEYLING
jgi:hypothetical protein